MDKIDIFLRETQRLDSLSIDVSAPSHDILVTDTSSEVAMNRYYVRTIILLPVLVKVREAQFVCASCWVFRAELSEG